MLINAEDFTDFYFYNEIVGCYPFDTNKERMKTINTMKYLIESGVPDELIKKILLAVGRKKAVITPKDLPDMLWENSLTKRNTFYYHHFVQLKEPMPVYSGGKIVSFKPFLEMKAHVTIKDLADYYYRTLKIKGVFRDYKRDEKALEYLLNKYSNLSCEALDIVLALIDEAGYKNETIVNPLNITNNECEVIEKLLRNQAEAHAAKKDIIVWRE